MTVYMFVQPYVWVMEPEAQVAGSGSAVIARTVRRVPASCIDPTVKNLQWGDLTRSLHEAADRGATYPSTQAATPNSPRDQDLTLSLLRMVCYIPPTAASWKV